MQGTTIKPLVKFLKVKTADKSKPTMTQKITLRVSNQEILAFTC